MEVGGELLVGAGVALGGVGQVGLGDVDHLGHRAAGG
jgi:hypothetical protein